VIGPRVERPPLVCRPPYRNLADGLLTLLALRASHYNQAVTRREVVAFVVVAVQPSAVVRGGTDSDAEGGSSRVRR